LQKKKKYLRNRWVMIYLMAINFSAWNTWLCLPTKDRNKLRCWIHVETLKRIRSKSSRWSRAGPSLPSGLILLQRTHKHYIVVSNLCEVSSISQSVCRQLKRFKCLQLRTKQRTILKFPRSCAMCQNLNKIINIRFEMQTVASHNKRNQWRQTPS
jgi:hypothetical protein